MSTHDCEERLQTCRPRRTLDYLTAEPSGSEVWRCPACHAHYEDPVSMSCGDAVCRACVATLGGVCPTCNASITEQVLPARPLLPLVQGLQCHCPNHGLGCSAVLAVQDVELHLHSDCEWRDEECDQCHQRAPRHDMASHKDTTCPAKRMGCGYAELGCETRCPQEDLAHEREGVVTHTGLLMQRLVATSAELAQIKAELGGQLAATKAELCQCKAELTDRQVATAAALAQTKAQLARCQEQLAQTNEDLATIRAQMLQGSKNLDMRLRRLAELARGHAGVRALLLRYPDALEQTIFAHSAAVREASGLLVHSLIPSRRPALPPPETPPVVGPPAMASNLVVEVILGMATAPSAAPVSDLEYGLEADHEVDEDAFGQVYAVLRGLVSKAARYIEGDAKVGKDEENLHYLKDFFRLANFFWLLRWFLRGPAEMALLQDQFPVLIKLHFALDGMRYEMDENKLRYEMDQNKLVYMGGWVLI
ncbi:hypothetical protein PAPYR_10470 [Paratrimastix pyriformis]|uniref:RING-type domain-containing protein n=1 Tax=Paratrimastix pyriformis TaxID=342808 RepID=A0ABQ8U9P1_9EUKA|nr:hypothetical protein PAPYR_10470 [Paratrimastix pyriformis]